MKSTKNNPKLNVRLLRKIKRHILAEPKRFLMSCGSIKANSQRDWRNKIGAFAPDASKVRPPCGTAACIAGWADLLTGGEGEGGYQTLYRATEALGLPPAIMWFGHPLFTNEAWPEPFKAQYREAKTPPRRAEVAANRIEHFIKTGE